MLVKLYNRRPIDVNETTDELLKLGERLKPYVPTPRWCSIRHLTKARPCCSRRPGHYARRGSRHISVCHVLQPDCGGACTGTGVGPTKITRVIGVSKAYVTRVGEGPFPTELFDETGDYIRNAGGEFGTVTGRPHRTGWFDAVVARYAVRVNGLTDVVINKIDPLRGLPKLKVCVAYKLKNGETVTEFPANFMDLVDCEPVYEEFDGFDEDITNCRSFEDCRQPCSPTSRSWSASLSARLPCLA